MLKGEPSWAAEKDLFHSLRSSQGEDHEWWWVGEEMKTRYRNLGSGSALSPDGRKGTAQLSARLFIHLLGLEHMIPLCLATCCLDCLGSWCSSDWNSLIMWLTSGAACSQTSLIPALHTGSISTFSCSPRSGLFQLASSLRLLWCHGIYPEQWQATTVVYTYSIYLILCIKPMIF